MALEAMDIKGLNWKNSGNNSNKINIVFYNII